MFLLCFDAVLRKAHPLLPPNGCQHCPRLYQWQIQIQKKSNRFNPIFLALSIIMIELVEVACDQEIQRGVPLGPGVGVSLESHTNHRGNAGHYLKPRFPNPWSRPSVVTRLRPLYFGVSRKLMPLKTCDVFWCLSDPGWMIAAFGCLVWSMGSRVYSIHPASVPIWP